MARVLEHQEVVVHARKLATAMLDDDPELTSGEHQGLRHEMEARFPAGALDVVQSG
jgi:hypothetical protein